MNRPVIRRPSPAPDTSSAPRRRMMHWHCPKCSRTNVEPILKIAGSPVNLPDAHCDVTCDSCSAERIERLKNSGFRPTLEACDRMIEESRKK